MANIFVDVVNNLLESTEPRSSTTSLLPNDIILRVGGIDFVAHKAILSAQSKYFERLFDGCTCNNDQDVVELEDLDPEIFEDVLEYIYSEEIRLNQDMVYDVLKAARYLKMNCLILQCIKYLELCINCTNCITFWKSAESNNDSQLASNFREYIISRMEEVKLLPDFLQLEVNEIKALIANETLRLTPELVELIYAGIVAWISYPPADRKDYLIELLDLMRMEYVSEVFFNTVISKDELLLANKDGTDWIRKRLPKKRQIPPQESLIEGVRRLNFSSLNQIPSETVSTINNNAVSSIASTAENNAGSPFADSDEQKFITLDGSLYRLTDQATGGVISDSELRITLNGSTYGLIKTPGYCVTSSMIVDSFVTVKQKRPRLNESLYDLNNNPGTSSYCVNAGCTVGPGEKQLIILDSTDRCYGFNIDMGRLTRLADRPNTPRYCAVSFRKDIYLFGGQDNTCGLKYVVNQNRWERQSIWSDFQCHSGVVIGGSAYITGGYFDGFYQNSMYRYTFGCNRMDVQPRMLLNRAYHGTTTYGNCIYACGGLNGPDGLQLGLTERYDIREGIWNCFPSMIHKYGNCSAAIRNGELYVSNKLNGITERFDFRRFKWEEVAQAPGSMGSLVSLNNELYCVHSGGVSIYSDWNVSWDSIINFDFTKPVVCSL